MPKPLVQIRGRPILSYLLDHLKKYEVEDIVIAAGFKAEVIKSFFEENHLDMNVSIVDSGDVDIISRIKSCAAHISGDFILLYGDTLANVNLEALQEFHYSHSLKASITVWPLKSTFGLFEMDEYATVVDYREKPTLKEFVNIGFFYMEHEVLSWLQDFPTFVDFLEFLTDSRKMKGFTHSGVHLTVNTLRELMDAEETIQNFDV
jgi:glucose-1-phosphate cytidylyltransferase